MRRAPARAADRDKARWAPLTSPTDHWKFFAPRSMTRRAAVRVPAAAQNARGRSAPRTTSRQRRGKGGARTCSRTRFRPRSLPPISLVRANRRHPSPRSVGSAHGYGAGAENRPAGPASISQSPVVALNCSRIVSKDHPSKDASQGEKACRAGIVWRRFHATPGEWQDRRGRHQPSCVRYASCVGIG
jgi:hypothetical protein